jgi:hypothetical protein
MLGNPRLVLRSKGTFTASPDTQRGQMGQGFFLPSTRYDDTTECLFSMMAGNALRKLAEVESMSNRSLALNTPSPVNE